MNTANNGFPTYFYQQQIRKYLVQFMSVFSNLKVSIGKDENDVDKLIDVPITYGSKDRVVASIIGKNTSISPIRVPAMSCYLRTIDLAEDAKKGVGAVRREKYTPLGGLPDDMKVVKQLMPTPYRLTVEVAIYTSNTDQRFQVLEQIMMVFDYAINLQTSDGYFDWTRLTTVTMKSISSEEQYPNQSTDRRILIDTLSFDFIAYIGAPTDLKNNIIKTIYARIAAVSEDPSALDSYDLLGELDGAQVPYMKIHDYSDST
jgi:hypothetical protein